MSQWPNHLHSSLRLLRGCLHLSLHSAHGGLMHGLRLQSAPLAESNLHPSKKYGDFGQQVRRFQMQFRIRDCEPFDYDRLHRSDNRERTDGNLGGLLRAQNLHSGRTEPLHRRSLPNHLRQPHLRRLSGHDDQHNRVPMDLLHQHDHPLGNHRLELQGVRHDRCADLLQLGPPGRYWPLLLAQRLAAGLYLLLPHPPRCGPCRLHTGNGRDSHRFGDYSDPGGDTEEADVDREGQQDGWAQSEGLGNSGGQEDWAD